MRAKLGKLVYLKIVTLASMKAKPACENQPGFEPKRFPYRKYRKLNSNVIIYALWPCPPELHYKVLVPFRQVSMSRLEWEGSAASPPSPHAAIPHVNTIACECVRRSSLKKVSVERRKLENFCYRHRFTVPWISFLTKNYCSNAAIFPILFGSIAHHSTRNLEPRWSGWSGRSGDLFDGRFVKMVERVSSVAEEVWNVFSRCYPVYQTETRRKTLNFNSVSFYTSEMDSMDRPAITISNIIF